MAEGFRFFLAELEDFPDQIGIVVGFVRCDVGRGFPDSFTQLFVLGVLHDGIHRWELEGEAEGTFRVVFCLGVRGGTGDGRIR